MVQGQTQGTKRALEIQDIDLFPLKKSRKEEEKSEGSVSNKPGELNVDEVSIRCIMRCINFSFGD